MDLALYFCYITYSYLTSLSLELPSVKSNDASSQDDCEDYMMPGIHRWKNEKVKVLVAQSCPTLRDLMDCSSPGLSVHGILQKKNTGVGSHSLLQEIFPTQGSNMGLPHCRCILCVWATRYTSTCPQTGTWCVLDHMETHCWTQRGGQEKEITIDRNKLIEIKQLQHIDNGSLVWRQLIMNTYKGLRASQEKHEQCRFSPLCFRELQVIKKWRNQIPATKLKNMRWT